MNQFATAAFPCLIGLSLIIAGCSSKPDGAVETRFTKTELVGAYRDAGREIIELRDDGSCRQYFVAMRMRLNVGQWRVEHPFFGGTRVLISHIELTENGRLGSLDLAAYKKNGNIILVRNPRGDDYFTSVSKAASNPE